LLLLSNIKTHEITDRYLPRVGKIMKRLLPFIFLLVYLLIVDQ